jgi:hypothetical protein
MRTHGKIGLSCARCGDPCIHCWSLRLCPCCTRIVVNAVQRKAEPQKDRVTWVLLLVVVLIFTAFFFGVAS